jgi:hypothetical protein
MTGKELAELFMQSDKPITYERLQSLKGAVLRENQKGNMITFEQVVAHLTPEQQQAVTTALQGKAR